MPRQSKLMAQLKQEEMLKNRQLPAAKRLEAAIAHSQLMREFCFAGLKKKGFSPEEIDRIYHGTLDE
jgi:hypothetical protein